MRLWRCINPACCDDGKQGHDFTSEGTTGTCDKCGVSSTDPRLGSVIVPRVVMHFHPPSKVKGIGVGHSACQPTRPIHEIRSTAVPSVVNCPRCMATDVFKACFEETKLHPDYDVPLEEVASVKGVVGFEEIPIPPLPDEKK